MIKKTTVYICGIAAQHELGNCKVRVYHSSDSLRRDESHKGCGVAEYELRFRRWLEPQGDLREGALPARSPELTEALIVLAEKSIAIKRIRCTDPVWR